MSVLGVAEGLVLALDDSTRGVSAVGMVEDSVLVLDGPRSAVNVP